MRRARFRPVTVRSRCLLVSGDSILVQKDKDGLYGLPGGRLEYDETIPYCAARELREEAGIEALPQRLVYVVEYVGHKKGRFKHEILFVFLCEGRGRLEPRRKEESITFEWRRPAELRGSFWPEPLVEYLVEDHPEYRVTRFLVFMEDRLHFINTLPPSPPCAIRFFTPWSHEAGVTGEPG